MYFNFCDGNHIFTKKKKKMWYLNKLIINIGYYQKNMSKTKSDKTLIY